MRHVRILAVIGAAGFIIGFALQGTLNNFASGIMILIYHPYDVGDVITAAGVTGKVEAMSMSSTTIKTPDNQVIIVPNGSIWGGIITNVTGSDTRRVDLIFRRDVQGAVFHARLDQRHGDEPIQPVAADNRREAGQRLPRKRPAREPRSWHSRYCRRGLSYRARIHEVYF